MKWKCSAHFRPISIWWQRISIISWYSWGHGRTSQGGYRQKARNTKYQMWNTKYMVPSFNFFNIEFWRKGLQRFPWNWFSNFPRFSARTCNESLITLKVSQNEHTGKLFFNYIRVHLCDNISIRKNVIYMSWLWAAAPLPGAVYKVIKSC